MRLFPPHLPTRKDPGTGENVAMKSMVSTSLLTRVGPDVRIIEPGLWELGRGDKKDMTHVWRHSRPRVKFHQAFEKATRRIIT